MSDAGNPCLILEWTDANGWPALFTGEPCRPGHSGPVRIPDVRRPAILQPDLETATTEAQRLARAHPAKRFAIFEAKLVGMTVDVPSHVTVSGKVWLTRKVAHVVEIDDSEIPF